jgi:hypothetical protein
MINAAGSSDIAAICDQYSIDISGIKETFDMSKINMHLGTLLKRFFKERETVSVGDVGVTHVVSKVMRRLAINSKIRTSTCLRKVAPHAPNAYKLLENVTFSKTLFVLGAWGALGGKCLILPNKFIRRTAQGRLT